MTNLLYLLEQNIRRLLRENRWSQNDLAKKAGIQEPQLNRYLCGKTVPGITVVGKLADALQCDPRELFRPATEIEHEHPKHETVEIKKFEFEAIESLLKNLKIHKIIPESFAKKLNQLDPDKRNSLLKIFETQVDMFLQNTKPKD
jgi:transcriptional regulator with XRE-family HTH domain